MKLHLALLVVLGLAPTCALAQDEYQDKIAEDLKAYEEPLKSACGFASLTLKWQGKLTSNPREGGKGNSLSTLCTSALAAVVKACGSESGKKALAKVETITCRRAKGTLSHKLGGTTLTLGVDPKFTGASPAAQQTALEGKLAP